MIKAVITDLEKRVPAREVEGEAVAGFAKDEENFKVFLVGGSSVIDVMSGLAEAMAEIGLHMMEPENDEERIILEKLGKRLLKRAFRRRAGKYEEK